MNEFSSKICPNCCSPQLIGSRFCDNCGNMFAAVVTPGEDGFSETKTFIRRQVADTRPLFWAAILLVGTLSVFGFAQAGVFSGQFGGYIAPSAVQSTRLALQETPASPEKQSLVSQEPAAGNTNPSNDPLLDLSDSVFDMGNQPLDDPATNKRRSSGKVSKAETVREPQIKNPEALTGTTRLPVDERAAVTTEQVTDKRPAAPASEPAAKVYIRGPLGGCYYLSASGSKRYVDRSICK